MSPLEPIYLQVIDQWLKYVIQQGQFPGFQVSIRKNSDLIFDKAYGYSNLQKKEKFTPSHRGRIASQSKTFTAVLILKLENEKRLALSDRVSQHIPELKNHLDRRMQKVTLLDLLTNRSGIIRDAQTRNYWSTNVSFHNKTQLLREVMRSKLSLSPGQQLKYSNIGYALLGLVVENITGQTYDELVQKKIVARIDGLQLTTDLESTQKLAYGYAREQIGKRQFLFFSHRRANALSPAAGFVANTRNTTLFFDSLFNRRVLLPRLAQRKLQSYVDKAKTNMRDQYGLGTLISDFSGTRFRGHSGGFLGFSSQTWFEPKSKLTIGFMTNMSTVGTFNFIRGIEGIATVIEREFATENPGNLIVSLPMADNVSSTIYVIGKKKCIGIPLGGAFPTEEVLIFRKHKNGFISHTISPYRQLGEPLKFKIKNKKVLEVDHGGFVARPVR